MEKRLRDAIAKILQNIKKDVFPGIYDAIQTVQGYQHVELLIIKFMVDNEFTPAECIPNIERILIGE